MRETVLVTDGEQRAALAVVRALGRAGYRCVVGSRDGRSLAGASRFAWRDVALPDPLAAPHEFARALAEAAHATDAAVVIPVSDAAALAALGTRDAFAPTRLPFPSLEAFRRLSDKACLLREAPALGIAVPAQQAVATRAATREARLTVPFPIVIKPARSVAETRGGRVRVGVRYAADPEQLRRVVAGFPDAAFPLLLQQRIVGPGIGIFLLAWDGQVVARFAHRRLREKPPSGGVSVYRKSVPLDEELAAKSAALLRRFEWQGVAMIEYKVDGGSGTPFLMEVNGRFWGSLQLAVDAGVDFPTLLVERALGRNAGTPAPYRTNVRSRWWWGDVDHLLARLRGGADLALPPDAPGLGRVLLDFATLWRPGDRNEILRLGDPRPFLRETGLWLRGR